MSDISSSTRKRISQRAREILADYASVEDLITIGAYKEGQNPRIDNAVKRIDAVLRFLKQAPEDKVDLTTSDNQLAAAVGDETVA